MIIHPLKKKFKLNTHTHTHTHERTLTTKLLTPILTGKCQWFSQ